MTGAVPLKKSPLITEQLHDALQRDGARARALGRTAFDNPYLKPENMPAQTGETEDLWNAKRDAWQMGWTIEDVSL
jgi:hypothetical protein